ncbi:MULTISPECIES: hypothetical protein [Escherichia]|nr:MULTISPECIES: hypothetical protein [Escherichia]MCA4891311.1 hypothetical protein [Escherichia whittamii]MCH0684668.1 hypothetical protein [Escherichia coli]MDZ7122930.1 hypothetical protein [Escherichia coli]MDZ8665275.1 hypothetical protein [Escherichia coli]MEB7935955.1 hypothetical protein [Escherichia whittamii]
MFIFRIHLDGNKKA